MSLKNFTKIKFFYTFLSVLILASLLSNTVASQTIYVSNSGNDSNSGTLASPVKTIQKAADLAMPGDTVFVFEGTYRERVAPPRGGTAGNEIVYKAEPGKNVYIKGSDIWTPTWANSSGNIFFATPNDSMFNDDCYVDNKNPFKVAVSSTPYGLNGKPEVDRGYGGDPNLILSIGQVFVDGELYTQKGYLNQLSGTDKSWYVNMSTGTIYIHFPDNNPTNHVVEISTRRRIFAPHLRQLGYIVVDGFIMEHCGNQYPTNFWETTSPAWQQAGALGTRSGHHWTIKNNIIRFAHGMGIDFGNEGNRYADLETGNNGEAFGAGYHIIDSNQITDNGAGGTVAYFPNYVTFINNIVERNNNLLFIGQKRWESAGVKMHGPNNSKIYKNLVRNNYGKWGLWLDGGSGNKTRVHGNVIIGHEIGFDLEIGTASIDKLILDNNVIINNEIGIGSRESGGITSLNNIIINSSKFGLENLVSNSRIGTWTSNHHHHFNNIFIDDSIHVKIVAPDYYKSSDRRFDYNIYKSLSTEDKLDIDKGTSTPTFLSWKNAWNAYNGGVNYDNNSRITNNITYTFNESTMQLNLNIGFDIKNAGIFRHDSLDVDFNGTIIPTDGTALPGPFQNLVQGDNLINLWNWQVKQPDTSSVIYSIDDAYVRGGTYAATNFGTADLQTKIDANALYARETYVKFDLANLPANTTNVKVRITTTNTSVSSWSAYFVANDNWTEETITWNNRPSGSTSLGTQSNTSSNTLEWDVTALALAELSGDKILSIKIIGAEGFHGLLHSKESTTNASLKPSLAYYVAPKSSLIAIDDAYVRGGTYAATNFGTADLQTKIDANALYTRESYIKFDLTNLPLNATNIKVRITSTNTSVSSWSAFFVANDSWTEEAITWNNRPSGSTSLGTQTNASSNTLEWDVTALALAELSGDKVLSIKITGAQGFNGLSHSKETTTNNLLKPVLTFQAVPTEVIAIDDAYVRGGTTYATTNFGTENLQTRTDISPRETYVKYDLTNVPVNANSVKVRITATNTSISTWDAFFVTNDNWQEEVITWNGKPSSSTSLGTQTNASSNTLEWDVTTLAQTELMGDKILSIRITGAQGFHGLLHSKESTTNNELKPKLIFTTEALTSYDDAHQATSNIQAKVDVPNLIKIEYSDKIADSDHAKIIAYPNPANDRIFFENLENGTNISLYNSWGQLLIQSTYQSYLEISSLTPGVYYVVGKKDGDKPYRITFIKQ